MESIRDNRFISDEEIIGILESFKNPVTNVVKIPIDDAQYHRIVSLAKNRGYSFKTFIESFGYKYRRTRFFGEKFKEKVHETRLSQLKKYKVTDNSVYISSYSNFYSYLTVAGKNKGYNLTNYLLKEFGLKRVEIKDLPDGYVPYELGDYEEDLDKEEKFLKHIENYLMLSDEDSFFYINSGTNFYAAILKYTTLIGTSVDNFFEKWELNRLNYQESLKYLISELDFTKEQASEFLDRTQNFNYNDDDSEDVTTVTTEVEEEILEEAAQLSDIEDVISINTEKEPTESDSPEIEEEGLEKPSEIVINSDNESDKEKGRIRRRERRK